MRRNRKTDNFDEKGFEKSNSNVLIYKQRNGKGYKKYKLIPILLDKYYIVNFSDLLYPYIVKKGYNSRPEARKSLDLNYDVSKRDFFNIVSGFKLSKIKPVLEGSIKFKLPRGEDKYESIKVGLADKLSLTMTQFLDLNPDISKLASLMYKKFHYDFEIIYIIKKFKSHRQLYRELGVFWPYHMRIAFSLESALRALYPNLRFSYLELTVALMANEPKILNKVQKPLNLKEYSDLKKYREKKPISKINKIKEAAARGFQNYKTESGDYKRKGIDLENNSYLIIPLSLLTETNADNKAPILIYPRAFQFSIKDGFSNYLGYSRTRKDDDHSYLSLWDAWKLLDCYCLPRIADKHQTGNIAKEIKRAKNIKPI